MNIFNEFPCYESLILIDFEDVLKEDIEFEQWLSSRTNEDISSWENQLESNNYNGNYHVEEKPKK